ncbi:M48 family metalloprotease [Anaerovibrio sp. RM50]|uniref:M48 family metalloprotease n=1 Tax=Anaerovibrio sp. RM50 TaxID=1200557 RepID=UPI0004846117|nr:M48 family metalloprotease [Anaerovibrio sp. RM50]
MKLIINPKKKIIACFMALALVASLFTANVSEAYVISDETEHLYGNYIEDEYANGVRSWHNDFIYAIQKELVEMNPTTLNFNDGVHSRYLYPIKESSVNEVDAVTLPSGRIFLSTQMIDFTMTIPSIEKIDYHNLCNYSPDSLYQYSMLAAVIAHEASHWYNRDFQRKIDALYGERGLKELLGSDWDSPSAQNLAALMTDIAYNKTAPNARFSVEGEYLADKQAVSFLNNSTRFSPGSLVSFLYRLDKHEKRYDLKGVNVVVADDYNPHPDTLERIRRLEKQISEHSYGRVTFSNQKFYLDGKPFMGTGIIEGNDRVSTIDRTYYVAGQIADIIHNGELGSGKFAFTEVYTSDNIHNADIEDLYLTCADGDTRYFKVIDRLKIRPNESRYMLGDDTRPSGYEYSYDAELARYIASYQ